MIKGILHPRLTTAAARLDDPALTTICNIKRGGAPGLLALQHATFPPFGISPMDLPAIYQITLEGHVTFELELMVKGYLPDYGRGYTLLGLITHDQWQTLDVHGDAEIIPEQRIVAIEYWAASHVGTARVDRDVYHTLQIIRSKELYDLRAREQRLAAEYRRRETLRRDLEKAS